MSRVPPVFVFGSNLAGRHGKGAARFALCHRGAVYGVGEGRQRNSYAIPTKDEHLQPLPLRRIAAYVASFLEHARHCPEDDFEVTPVGCGLAGFRPEDIAPMFREAPANCALPEAFKVVLTSSAPPGVG